MALTEKQYSKIREELDNCQRPIFFFHDDPDGLCSFLQFYRYKREGRGVVVKSTPKLTEMFARKVEEYGADKVFALDLALVQQEFIDAVNVPIIVIDHHSPLDLDGIKYYNPRKSNAEDNHPISYVNHKVVKQDMWISAVGCVGDWFFPPFAKTFRKNYPSYLPEKIKRPEDALFNTKLGELVKIFSNILKGKTTDVMKCIKILTRIEHPDEIIKQTSPQGRFIYKRSEVIEKDYKKLLQTALKSVTDDNLLVFTYSHAKMSFTKELANELLYRYPKKRLLICREKSGDMKCSLRSTDIILPPILEKALIGIEGYGGGHEHACGANIKVADFQMFIENLKQAIEDEE